MKLKMCKQVPKGIIINSNFFPPVNSGWLVLGGVYDSASDSVDQSGGMTGRLSHTYISSKALSQSEVSTLVNDRTAIPADPISGFTVAMATGATAATDYESELAAGVCLSSSGCKSLDASEFTCRPT